MNGPSPHLSWDELGCHDGTPYPEIWRKGRAVALAVEFETIRKAVGQPIVIGSAYRTREYNAQVGGTEHSQHCEGRALDLYPPYELSVSEFYAIIRLVARNDFSAIRGLGRYPTFVHIDIRPSANNRLVVWSGARAWAEVRNA